MALFVERAGADYLTGQELVDQLGAWLAGQYQAVETELLEQIARQVAQDLDAGASAHKALLIFERNATRQHQQHIQSQQAEQSRIMDMAADQACCAEGGGGAGDDSGAKGPDGGSENV